MSLDTSQIRQPTSDQISEESRTSHLGQYATLTFVISSTTLLNLWWIFQNRIGLTFDIDEAGYLVRALEDRFAFQSGGPITLFSQFHSSDPQAPLLPLVAGLLDSITKSGSATLIYFQQVFYVLLLIATYFLSVQLVKGYAAVVAVCVVAATPGILEVSRTFQFGLVASAMFTLCVAVQLYAEDFDRWQRALFWGLTIGLTTLSRTMVLGLLPGLFIALVVRLLKSGINISRIRNLAMGGTLGLAIAASWYSASWKNVINYLTSYGYGAQANQYGQGDSILSTTWWTTRPIRTAQEFLLAPITLLIVALTLIVIARLVSARTSQVINRNLSKKIKGQHAVQSTTLHEQSSARTGAISPKLLSLLICIVYGYLALSSTSNSGSYFELTLVPIFIVLIITSAFKIPRFNSILIPFCLIISVLSFATSTGPWFQGKPLILGSGSHTITLFDGRGSLISYSDTFIPNGGIADLHSRRGILGKVEPEVALTSTPDIDAMKWFLRAQNRSVDQLAADCVQLSIRHKRSLILMMGEMDPFVNSNTLGLRLFEMTGKIVPIGILSNRGALSIKDQLTMPEFGMPNTVIVGPNASNIAAAAFSPMVNPLSAMPVLKELGFKEEGFVMTPDSRKLQIWWRLVGPALP
jgi:Dolichyl-phosphate-mannose-protein mannosyltransferase